MSNSARTAGVSHASAARIGLESDGKRGRKVVVPDDDGTCTCPFCRLQFKVNMYDPSRRYRNNCNKCGYGWNSRSNEPAKCPRCGSYSWNRILPECDCKVCGYVWVSRKEFGPTRCPNCKSTKWREPPRVVEKKIVVAVENTEELNQKWIMERYEEGQGCVEIAAALGLPVFKVMAMVKEAMDTKYNPRV